MTKTEKILKYLIYLCLVIILVIPFILTNNLYYEHVTGKAFTFRIVVEILVAVWLILAILYPKYRPKKNWILISFVLFVLSLFFSNLFGVNPEASFWSNLERMEGWVTIVHLLGLFIVMGSVLRIKKEWYVLFNISVVGSVVMFILALKQTIDFGNSSEDLKLWGGVFRLYTTIGNPIFLAAYALFNAFLSLLLLFKDTEKLRDFFKRTKETCFYNWQIWFYILAFILNSWMIYQSVSRGPMLGFIGGLVLIGLLMAFLEKEKVIYKKIAIGLISVTILFIGTVFAFRETSFVQNNQSLDRFTSVFEFKGSVHTRFVMWYSAYKGFQERPILGWGQNNFNYVFDKYLLPSQHGMNDEIWADRAHNVIFDWLIVGGIFGLLFYLSIWVATVLSIFKTKKFKNIEKSILISMLAGYFFHLLFIFDVLVSYLYFVFILALTTSKNKNKKTHQYQISDSLKKILITSIILITPFVVYLVNYQPYKAAKELQKTVGILDNQLNGQTHLLQSDIVSNMEYFQSVISRDTFATPEMVYVMMAGGENVFKLGNENKNIQKQLNELKSKYLSFVFYEVQVQMEKDPKNSRYPYMLSNFLAQSGNYDEAEEYALRAIKLSPTKQTIRIPLIRIYSSTGQSEKALTLAKETYELDETKKDLWIEYVKVASKFDGDLLKDLISLAIENGNEKWIKSISK